MMPSRLSSKKDSFKPRFTHLYRWLLRLPRWLPRLPTLPLNLPPPQQPPHRQGLPFNSFQGVSQGRRVGLLGKEKGGGDFTGPILDCLFEISAFIV